MAEVSKTVRIQNELGLHARAASKLVQTAARFPVEIQIGHADMMVNSKSIMGVLMLAAAQGTDLNLVAHGDATECERALDAITALVDGLFGEGK
jgi:phosphocarrier protein HPr